MVYNQSKAERSEIKNNSSINKKYFEKVFIFQYVFPFSKCTKIEYCVSECKKKMLQNSKTPKPQFQNNPIFFRRFPTLR